jgi:uncharacterized membrane protein YecN with MAPEG domain
LAALAVLSIWLMLRIGSLRNKFKVSHGDGGNELILRRMRAQLNFVETAPFVVGLIAFIELTSKGTPWIAYVAAAYVICRICHAIGMDKDKDSKLRGVGVMGTMLTLLGLAIVATLIVIGLM